jgi:hypothetical protein
MCVVPRGNLLRLAPARSGRLAGVFIESLRTMAGVVRKCLLLAGLAGRIALNAAWLAFLPTKQPGCCLIDTR